MYNDGIETIIRISEKSQLKDQFKNIIKNNY